VAGSGELTRVFFITSWMKLSSTKSWLAFFFYFLIFSGYPVIGALFVQFTVSCPALTVMLTSGITEGRKLTKSISEKMDQFHCLSDT
jgi:hypothetical protein